jgi:hypothetical protein
MRNGVEIWIEKDRASNLIDQIEKRRESKFVKIDEQILNTADIVGIFDAKTMEEMTRRRNGEWLCKWNEWHNRGEKCFCGELKKYDEKYV